ncbi:hypothetical protein FBQ97_13380 [Acidobacteria bacterium ACD]|nr:hypothetical protein [Acidobacteria bacterium ACD]
MSLLAAAPARPDVIPAFGALGVDIPWDPKPPESMPVWVDCDCVTHGTIEPCAKAVALSMRDEECEGSAGHPCEGHGRAGLGAIRRDGGVLVASTGARLPHS